VSKDYQVLLSRFEGEIEDLDMIAKRISRAWGFASSSCSEQDMFLDSVALQLHGLYSGLEGLFMQVALHIDEKVPKGNEWHRDLLVQMQDETSLRPALFTKADADFLDELRRFRHLIRNIYAFNLLPSRIEPLVKGVVDRWPKLRGELVGFVSYIQSLVAADTDS